MSSAAMLDPILNHRATGLHTALTVQGLTVRYADSPVLDDVSINVPECRVTAIMGPSGCGKSTLVKLLNRSLELAPGANIQQGEIRYAGVDLYRDAVDPRVVRKRIGLIQQRPVPFPMSIEENVLFGVRFHERPRRSRRREIAEHYLRKAGLWSEVRDRLRRSALGLSGGQQQRLCLARSLANRPDVILMDEPCSSLDPASTARIEDLVRDLSREYTLVIVTHNLAQARRIADHAIFMLGGRVVEQGDAAELFAAPRTAEAQDFIAGRTG